MTPEAFVADLDRTNREALKRLGAAATAGEPADHGPAPGDLAPAGLLASTSQRRASASAS